MEPSFYLGRGATPVLSRRRLLADDRVLREGEGRLGDFLLGVLVAVGESRQTPDPHNHHGVTDPERYPRRGLRDGDLDAIARTHGVDRRLVARVQARGKLPGHRLHLVGDEGSATDVAVAREHAVRERETKEFSHNSHPSPSYMMYPFRPGVGLIFKVLPTKFRLAGQSWRNKLVKWLIPSARPM